MDANKRKLYNEVKEYLCDCKESVDRERKKGENCSSSYVVLLEKKVEQLDELIREVNIEEGIGCVVCGTDDDIDRDGICLECKSDVGYNDTGDIDR